MKDQNYITCHPFLCYQHFFISIYYKIPTLVVSAFFSITNNLSLCQSRQKAKFGSNHYWNLTNLDLVLLLQNLFAYYRSDTCSRVFITKFELFNFYSCVYLSLIIKTSNSCLMRQYVLVRPIRFQHSWVLIYSSVSKYNLVSRFFIVLAKMCSFLLNVRHPKFLYNLLNRVLKEAFK